MFYYYLNKFNELICSSSYDKSVTVLGTVDEDEFFKLTDQSIKENKIVTIDSSNKLVLADKPFKPILPRSYNDQWLEQSFSNRNSLSYLCSHLLYHYINDDMSNGVDDSSPLIKYDNKIYTVDTAREYINLHQYDDPDHTAKSESLKTQLIAAKTYIRDHIVEL